VERLLGQSMDEGNIPDGKRKRRYEKKTIWIKQKFFMVFLVIKMKLACVIILSSKTDFQLRNLLTIAGP
jgi:hypothetical protein